APARRRARYPGNLSRRQGGTLIVCLRKKRRAPKLPPLPFRCIRPQLWKPIMLCSPLSYFLLPDPAAQVHPVGVAGIDIAGIVDADPFERAEVDGLGNECRDLAVLGAADADALLEARV